jgi:hypothetical protein
VLVAESDKKSHLKNVRSFGQTHSRDSDTTQKSGYFHIKFKANAEDILIIGNPGRNGSGSIVYFSGRLLKQD